LGACNARISGTLFNLAQKIAFGTDARVSSPHGDNARQIWPRRMGHETDRAIQAATIRSADFAELVRKAGVLDTRSLREHHCGHGDPLSDVRVLESVKFVMKNGAVVRNVSRQNESRRVAGHGFSCPYADCRTVEPWPLLLA